MDYIGEHLFPGKIGHFFILLSFAASLVATLAFYRAATAKDIQDELNWKRLARIAFAVDALAVFSAFITIYYIVSTHLFEYNYAWEHSSKQLNVKYLLACIWEGQEGSFLLWTMWHCVLGGILIFRAKKWEAPVMTVISFAQLCLATMIMGIYFGAVKVGHNPFLLVRQMFSEAPIFNTAEYLSSPSMQNGQGLNALLQNYWMVIHPPVLFLGFASTIVPFAFAIAGLWKKDYGGWTKAALPWTLFSACVLGTGIMMGAAWAYESLTFGGYWAWDPVENASLVPWLVIIAGLHTQVVYNSTGHSLRATYLFLILGYMLVLYSTFLTRSGVLGDSSVHAFTDLGMNLQLVLFILVFLVPSAILYAREYRKIPHIQKEENTDSREFWMFIGSLVIFLSALFIIVGTSLPVFNKSFGTNWSMGEDVQFAYNRIEVFIAIILGLLTAITQYFKYRQTGKGYFRKKILLPVLIALACSGAISAFGGIHYDQYGAGFLAAIHLAMFGAVFSVIANAGYIFSGLKGKLKAAGGSVAHMGFGLMLIGIIFSSAKKEVVSVNTTGINIAFDPKSKQNPLENATLVMGLRTDMGKYWATYENSDSVNDMGNITYFKVHFENKQTGETFNLYPNLIRETKGTQGFGNNPDKQHYLTHDIFAYVNASDFIDQRKDTSQFRFYPMAVHDTVMYSNGYVVLDSVVFNPDNDKYKFSRGDTALMARLLVVTRDSMRYTARPVYVVKNNIVNRVLDTLFAQNIAFGFSRVLDKKIEISIKESPKLIHFVSLKVLDFPHINLLWLGTIIMIIGLLMSMIRRFKLADSGKKSGEPGPFA